jgi:hypothetical protein
MVGISNIIFVKKLHHYVRLDIYYKKLYIYIYIIMNNVEKITMKEFLKTYTGISIKFIDEYYKFLDMPYERV